MSTSVCHQLSSIKYISSLIKSDCCVSRFLITPRLSGHFLQFLAWESSKYIPRGISLAVFLSWIDINRTMVTSGHHQLSSVKSIFISHQEWLLCISFAGKTAAFWPFSIVLGLVIIEGHTQESFHSRVFTLKRQ